MTINSTGLIYFSPTRGTQKVAEAIAAGTGSRKTLIYDLTYPSSQTREQRECNCDLAVIGAPVYAGRLPETMVSRFSLIRGHATPTVIVVVYGNRAYEDALLELNDLAVKAGFIPVAAAAFIAEHSYSTGELPIASGRPDQDDLSKARAFGEAVVETIKASSDTQSKAPLTPPGHYPYREPRTFAGITPSVDENLCTKCLTCVTVCPTAAIREDDPQAIAAELCIRCCACVKSCPARARTLNHPQIRQIAEFLSKNCKERKEPEMYFKQHIDN